MLALLSLLLLSFSILTAVQGKFSNEYYYEGNNEIGRKEDFFHFRTRPDLLAPRWNITIHDEEALAPGYFAVAPYRKLAITKRGEAWIGPHIYDQKGELVWSGAGLFDHYKAFDIRLANVSGVEMMTAMYPHENSAAIINKHYEIVQKVVHSSAEEYANMHDFNVVEDGSRALVLTKDGALYLSKEMSAVVGYDGNCLVRGDGLKYLDITTSPPKVLMSWNGTDHIGLDETTMRKNHDSIDVLCSDADKWDIHHLNSIDIMPDGDFLVSSRSTSTLYKISHKTGEIVWRLGGEKSDFDLPEDAYFHNQHHARVHDHNETHIVISLMDNSKAPRAADTHSPRPYSAGLMLALDTNIMTGQLIGEFPHPYWGRINKRGSAHLQRNGNMLMGWADNVLISEHAPDGRVLLEANILPKFDNYRSYKFSWVGKPLAPPDIYCAAFVSGDTTYTMVSVSWNGATEVERWELYEIDPKSGSQQFLTKTKRTGFETDLTVEGYAEHVIVIAIDKDGKSIGKSRRTRTTPSANYGTPSNGVLASSTSTAPSEVSHSVDVRPQWPAEGMEDEISGTAGTSNSQHGTWADFVRDEHFVALSSGLGGFVVCAALIAAIWALVKFRVSSRWSSGSARYAPIHHDQHDVEEDDDLEAQNED